MEIEKDFAGVIKTRKSLLANLDSNEKSTSLYAANARSFERFNFRQNLCRNQLE